MRRKWKFVMPMLALLSTCLLFRFVLFIGYVPSESMEPTLKKGSIIVGSRRFGELKVGDIIVFRHKGKLLVKRIAATEGDMVEYKGHQITVPKGYLYVLGDNAENSNDSRKWNAPFVAISCVRATIGSV